MEDQTRARTPDVPQRHVSSSRSSRRNRRRGGEHQHQLGCDRVVTGEADVSSRGLPSSLRPFIYCWRRHGFKSQDCFPLGKKLSCHLLRQTCWHPPSLTPYPPLGNIPMSPWRWNGSFVAFSFFFFFSDLIIYYWPHTLLSKSFRHVWPLTTSVSVFFFLKLEKNVFRPTAAISLNNSLFQFFFKNNCYVHLVCVCVLWSDLMRWGRGSGLVGGWLLSASIRAH